MRTSTLQGVLGRLRRLGGGELEPSDAELLACFGSGRVEAAFTLLLERHGAMVLGVCRRVLRDTHEAEDAFQATFLALAQGAGSVRKQGSLASWLYSVALRVAVKAHARRSAPAV
ncbi:MAG TPA: sigma-70 family RNA polymerase sigma factor [Gemmataceae bacterium]|nr:sigma-70 family RNA polymerase sigma factor [Gemmataceae bacterium]